MHTFENKYKETMKNQNFQKKNKYEKPTCPVVTMLKKKKKLYRSKE